MTDKYHVEPSPYSWGPNFKVMNDNGGVYCIDSSKSEAERITAVLNGREKAVAK